MDFTIRIGLEVHIQLKTATRLFSAEPYAYGQSPNRFIDPVTLGLPGTLPSINARAIDQAITLALAAQCSINRRITFDRKNYFYPDLPKGYQITQKTNPVGIKGSLDYIDPRKKIRTLEIKQVHLEEDSGKSIYQQHRISIDYNRAGVPLAEVVTSPGLSSPGEAAAFVDYLKILVRELGISTGKMETGAIRCDANISLSRPDETHGHNEIKNLNSTRALKKALTLEIERQKNEYNTHTFKRGYTLHFDDQKNINLFGRKKESAAEYGYIPEPDILPVYLSRKKEEKLKRKIPELPAQRYQRFMEQYQLSADRAYWLTMNKDLSCFFESIYPGTEDKQELIHFLTGPYRSLDKKINRRKFLTDKRFKMNIISLINMITRNEISRESAYQNLWPMLPFSENKTTFDLAKSGGWLLRKPGDELLEVIRTTIAEFPEEVSAYRNGKSKILGFFMGFIINKTKKRYQPQKIKRLLLEELRKSC
ncbi:MAG: Asp-tRNA(Asn)/Glu-tRNA(Gln) amidotransferase subunit GatB [Bacteroidales bacterium]|jgi:aspartyl-tRNA(Asn)/glutamyl-tRNA(Gln) amidotransferase subunit B|nr:Asp-tRNA(Asn)/Glu-tRNA(Gln) amidotransferase subunit GatB [Bacteroidales bacterium]